jgi:uncharacterized protein (TIGR03083 family)
MKRGDVFAAVSGQRRLMADLIEPLSDEQLATSSLCAGWDVKTVAAHVVSTIDDGLPTFLRFAARRGSLDRAIDELARRRAEASAPAIASALRQCADHPVDPPLFGPLDPLADVLVHLGDICTPLGIDYEPDAELVRSHWTSSPGHGLSGSCNSGCCDAYRSTRATSTSGGATAWKLPEPRRR